jgi:hypothetical protein
VDKTTQWIRTGSGKKLGIGKKWQWKEPAVDKNGNRKELAVDKNWKWIDNNWKRK